MNEQNTETGEGPQAFRWRLVGGRLPPLTAALRIGDAARAAVYRGADARGHLPLPDRFHTGSDSGHGHAFWLAEDSDDDGYVDHVLLFAASGLPDPLIPVLAEGGLVRLADLGQWRLKPDWMGRRAPGALFGPARVWVTASAYVTPLQRVAEAENSESASGAARLSPEHQLRWEIGMRRVGARVEELTVFPDIVRGSRVIPANAFTLKIRSRKPPSHAVLTGARIVFARPVWGPLAFGFGAHFGLGLFEPVDGFDALDEQAAGDFGDDLVQEDGY